MLEYCLFPFLGVSRGRSWSSARRAVGRTLLLLLLLHWSLFRRHSIYPPAIAPRVPYPTWAIETLKDGCRLQMWRWRWRHVVWSHGLVGKTGTPWIVRRRWATCCKLLGLCWGIRCQRWRRLWATDHVAEEVAQVPGRRLRCISYGSKGRLRYSSCSTNRIYLPYPTGCGRCGVQNRSAAIRADQLVT